MTIEPLLLARSQSKYHLLKVLMWQRFLGFFRGVGATWRGQGEKMQETDSTRFTNLPR